MMKTVFRLTAFLRPFWGWVLLSILIGTATIASGIGLLGTSAYLIAKAALHPSIAYLQVAIVGVRFFGILRGVSLYVERLVSHSVNFRLLAQLRGWFYRSVEPLAPAGLTQTHSGDLLNRAITDIETLENFYVRVVAPPVIALITTLGLGAFFGQFHPVLGVVLIVGLLISGAGVPVLARLLSWRPGKLLVDERSRLNTLLVESIQGISDLSAYSQEETVVYKMRQANQAVSHAQSRLAWTGALSAGLNLLAANLTMWVILWVSVNLVQANRFDGVMLAVLAMMTLAGFEAVNPLGQAAQLLESSLQSGRRLFELAAAIPAVHEPDQPVQSPLNADLYVHGLHFAYNPGEFPVLVDIDLQLPEGKKIALVGPSGAGKSSLVNVLLRFWPYERGRLTLGNCELNQLPSEVVRRYFSVIPQSTTLFSGTVRQNLLLANPQAGEDALVNALRRANLMSWLSNLPQGLDTWIGEQGQQISGGERQRLAVARALLRSAPILILDEATANLDAINERQLLETIFEVAEQRSILLITHRLVQLERMDEILVLNNGRIVERGTHADLLRMNGLYARMLKIQNQALE